MKKFLFIRFSSIGDIVLTTPVVRCLKLQLGAEIHFLTKKSFKNILLPNPHIDRVFSIEKKVGEVLAELKKEGYDGIIDLHKNLRSQQVRWALRKPYFSFDKINFEKWLLVNLKVNRLPRVHIVMRYLQAVKPMGVKYDGGGLDYFFQNKKALEAMDLLDKNYIAFAIGGAHATKRLPPEKIIEFCQKIKNTIVLLGGKGDAAAGEKVAQICGARVKNLCGKTSLDESAWFLKNATKVLTHDTGMMHIAAAFEKEIVSIWGNTIPEFGMYPFYPDGMNRNENLEVKNLSCRPCSKIGFEKCPKGHFRCMQMQNLDRID